MKVRAAILIAAILVVSVPVRPVFAQTPQQPQLLKWCSGQDNPTPDLQISSCTLMIVAIQSADKFAGNDLAIAYSNRSFAYTNKGDYDQAIRDCDEAIKIKPNYAEAYYNRGRVYGEKDQYDRAIADYNQAIRLNPNNADAYYNRGIMKQRKGDRAGGNTDIQKARAIQPGIGP